MLEKPIWTPDSAQAAASQMMKFMRLVNQRHEKSFERYDELYEWSVEHTEQFWPLIWEFGDIIASQPWSDVLIDGNKMPGARWFAGAKLNFAENLLKDRSSRTALIAHDESGYRREISYAKLYTTVSMLASAMRHAGVNANDRVAAFLPNIPETIIAMLATTSIGAIWSSCSPDFGEQGVLDRFAQIEPKLLFTCDGHIYNGKRHDALMKMQRVTSQIPSLEKIIVVPYMDDSPTISNFTNAILFNDFIDKNAGEIEFEQLPFDHPLYILYSSGTTGKPKCIVHGAGGTLLQHTKELRLHTDLSASDVLFYFTTCGWMMWNWMVSGLSIGATLVLYDGSPLYPKPERLFDVIDQDQVSVFGTSAKYLSTIEKEKLIPAQSNQLNALRCILSTASPLLPANYRFVYEKVKSSIQLSSISGGTDIVSCFALGNPLLPVYSGELQCRGLGMAVAIFDQQGHAVVEEKGELVCRKPFPAMPLYFWNDPADNKYQQAYFEKFPSVWAHSDYAKLTQHGGLVIYGRSDAILNPGGVRIGTAEIYRQVEKIDEVLESIVVGQSWQDDVRVILFIKLRDGMQLNDDLQNKIKQMIRSNTSPRHVPAKIIEVADIPRTMNGKIVELAVKNVIEGKPVLNTDAIANPESLELYHSIAELQK